MANEKRKLRDGIISITVTLLLGAILGVLFILLAEWQFPEDITKEESIARFFFMMASMYLAVSLHVVIHEGGHLIFGLLSGYTFSSFRIGSVMVIMENNRLKVKRMKIAGTAGQCLMVPPEMVDGKIPVMAYNFGGAILNFATSLLFLGLLMVMPKSSIAALFSIAMIAMGLVMGMLNGIPMRMQNVDNDGYNALSLQKDKEAMRALWIQLKVNDQLSRGKRLRDMPAEWFSVPSDNAMKNSMVAVLGVYAYNYLMDQHRFEEADAMMVRLLNTESGMAGLHRYMMMCDRITCELIGENRPEILEGLYTKEQRKFMKSMSTSPSVLRTEYAYAILAEKDSKKAAKLMKRFENVAKTYPYPIEITAERELMQIANEKATVQS